MILSFLTMYRSAKKSTFIAIIASRFPRPTLVVCSWLRRRRAHILASPDPAGNDAPEKVIKYAACFPTWPNFQGE